jgi:sulfide dehydrogenase cytochrome subunit
MRGICAFAVFLVATGACAAPDQDRHQGAAIAATCAACHRLDGRAAGIPSIVGLGSDRLVAMMQAFKADTESHHLMHAVSLTLSDQEVEAVAHYLATLGKEAKAP